jgi:hypothetical protein
MSPIADLFRPRPVSRFRATLTLIFIAAALLCAGGALEYGTGSPMTTGTTAAGYWSLFFTINVVAFGGAASIGAFPLVARPAVKGAWLIALVILYVVDFRLWSAQHPGAFTDAVVAWLRRSSIHLPAAFAIVCGLLWGNPEE